MIKRIFFHIPHHRKYLKNIKKIIILIFLLFTITLYPDWVEIQENSQKRLFEKVYSNLETTEIIFSLNGYEIENISELGRNFQKISYWNEGEFLEPGKPYLPRFTRLLALPNEGEVSIEIINFEEEVLSNIIVYPTQELQFESKPKNTEFTFDENYYLEGEKFPSQIVEIGNPAIMRDLRVVNVTINPFQYNPQTHELKIFKNVEFIVKCEGSGGVNVKTTNRTQSMFFESTYKSLVLNYNSESPRQDEFHQPNYLFIYPENPQVESILQNLIGWKHQKGFHVVSASTSQTGTTLNSIKNYIQNAYNTWENPPEFICLIGDAGGNFSIPTGHIDGGEGDHYYVLLEGNDILADAFIGRLSFNSIFELQTIIYKILHYEKEPYLGNTNWYNKALLVGDPTTSGQSCVNTKISIKEMINQYSENFSFIEVYSAPWVSQMSNGFNEGVSYFNYRGFYGMSGWDLDEISNLNNGFMLPVAVLLTCNVGDFEGTYDSRTERFLKAGSPGNPKGAIAAIGTATYDTNTCFNNCVDAGIYYGIFVDNIYHLGGALNRGKLNLYNCYPNNPYNAVYKFSYYNNLMGDPGMEIWTGSPEPMLVTYDSQVAVGSNLLEVMVLTSAGIPIENAWVTILKGNDEIFSTGYTDNNGVIYLPIESDNTGEVNLTATRHNYIPHLGIFNIVQNDVFVNVFEIVIDDDNIGSSSGNGDSIINPGEDIELNVSLKNFGSITANSISATISSDNDFITITDNTESYGNIPAGTSVFSPDDFDFSVDSNVLGGSELIIDISILDINNNEWNDKLYLNIEGPNLQPVSYSIIDGNNSVLDPGETAELTVTIENIGSVSSDEISGFLSCSNNQITIIDPDGFFGNILSGGQATNNTNRFIISANQEIIPGTQFALELQLYNASGYDNTVSFILEVGEVFITDPLGPDLYGYYCYDDGDISYDLCPNYSWIEIDPNYGGLGTTIPLYDCGDMGDTEEIDLPFILKFYGKNYTSITVCSNGWIAPGVTESMSFMNWIIPGPLGPSPIIAPFWDDLKIGYGNVCYFFDQTQNYFIIEWSHLQNDYDNSEETFQVILYNSNHYPTITGDSKILFQYETINNVDQGNYGTISNHGEYATVGLEDHTGTIGLEYTYSNQYPTAAKVLEDEMAILFTTPSIPSQGPFIILDSFEIDDSQGNNNGIVNPGETIAMPLTLRNIGNETAFNVTALLSTTDTFVNITDSLKSFGNIDSSETGTSLGDYIFDVTTICPDQHIIVFDLNITADGDYEWSSSFVVEVLSSEIATSTDTLDFEEIYIGYPESMTLTISNTGSDVLNVTDIYSDNPDFSTNITSFYLGGGESQDVVVTVNTSFVGIISDTLFIISNDPHAPEVYISLLGLGVDLLPPDISVYPESINEELYAGEISQQELIIENNGITDLVIEIDCPDNLDVGMAVSFDGIDDYVSLGDHSSLHPNFPFSISAWVKIDSSCYNTIFANDTVGPNYYGFWLKTHNLNQISITTCNGGPPGPNSRKSYTTDSEILFNEWYHIAAVATSFYDRIIYINGYPVNCHWSGSANTMVYNGDEARIGQSRNSSFFNGTIDDVRFWNYARSQLEIQSTMYSSLTGNETGLIGYWNFNSINPWDDLSGNGNNGNPHGNVVIVESTSPIIGWLSSNPVVCTIPPDSLVSIEITFDAAVLEVGSYETEIIISSNDPDTPEVVVPVSLNVLSNGIVDNIYPLITKLEGNYPNPFNPSTTISFSLTAKDAKNAKLEIFNLKGQKVRQFSIFNGQSSIVWDGSDDNSKPVSSGIYLYKLQVGKSTFIKKMLLLK